MGVSVGNWSEALGEPAGGHVRAAGEGDAIGGVSPAVVVEPTTVDEVAAAVAFADAERLKVLVRGGGTQSAYGYPPIGGDLLLSTRKLDRLVEHEPGDMTATAEAGMTLADFQAALGEAGQWLALDPALPPATTIGGIVATAASGPRRLRYGGVRDQIIGVQIVRADGVLAKGGGKVVKNVAGFDLPKLLTGSFGTLGVIATATFRLYPKPLSSRTVFIQTDDFGPLCDLAVKIIATTLVASAITVVGTNDVGRATLLVRFEGSESATEEQAQAVIALASALASEHVVVPNDDEAAVWHEIAKGPGTESADAEGRSALRLKVSLLPTKVQPWLALARERATRLGVMIAWHAHVGHGLLDLRLRGDEAGLRAIVADLRAAALGQGGSLVVTEAPPAILALIDPWGPSPALSIMRRVKEQFDPHGTLNPGRFIGGI